MTSSQSEIAGLMIDKIKSVALANVQKSKPEEKASQSQNLASQSLGPTNKVIAIASSTGGTEALKVFLAGMPADIPPTLIAQHMPAVFTKHYAESLNKLFPFEVKEAEEGDEIKQGRVLIAPGNFHLEAKKIGSKVVAHLHQEPLLHNVRPAADFLLKSVAKIYGKNAFGVVLTGMGRDGAAGLLEMRQAGSYTLAQNESTCVVYGMPKVAHEMGAVEKVLPLQKISAEILQKLLHRTAA